MYAKVRKKYQQSGADLDGHIEFADKLIEKYDWSASAKQDLTARIEQIRKKQQDQKLNLSVIGEFSCGKSTFINALLRTDLLEAGVLQGTTVTSTVIENGDEYKILLRYKNGKQEEYWYDNLSLLRDGLNSFTSQNEAAEDLYDVVVRFPCDALSNGGYRIIDTPGLNANTRWHADTTIRTLQEISDLSIILIDAGRPMPESLCQFIQDNLEMILEQCVFVVTKMDQIQPKEWDGLIDYVERVVESKLGIESPLVLPYSSVDVINTVAPGSYPKPKYEQDISASWTSESRIMQHMAQQRAVAQAKKLIELIDRIYIEISDQMNQLKEGYEERLEYLNRSKQADLNDFVQKHKELCAWEFDDRVRKIFQNLKEESGDLARCAQQSILSNIGSKSSTDDLNNYINRRITQDCMDEAEALCRKINQRIGEEAGIQVAYDRILKKYQEAFQNQFRKLQCLVPEEPPKNLPLPFITMPSIPAIELAGDYTQEMVSKENRMMGGGAAAGAALGSAILPGIGTVVGAFLGSFGGYMHADRKGANVSDMIQKVKQKVKAPLREYFDNIANQAMQQAYCYRDDIKRQINTEIDRYLTTYQQTVDYWIKEQENSRSALESQVQNIQADMHLIEDRQKSLNSIRRHF